MPVKIEVEPIYENAEVIKAQQSSERPPEQRQTDRFRRFERHGRTRRRQINANIRICPICRGQRRSRSI